MKFIIKVLITACAVMLTAWLLDPHIHVDNFLAGIIVALVLAVLNAIVRPILLFISIPATILTLGLFIFVINAMIILLAAYLIGSKFQVENFWWALLFSIIVSLFSSILNSVLKTDSPQQ
ncbi:MAG TPA: phage holin family protein [Bacteroidales bacterium]|nr:phage holin family protein [Bacteroidales bacterium]